MNNRYIWTRSSILVYVCYCLRFSHKLNCEIEFTRSTILEVAITQSNPMKYIVDYDIA